MSYTKIETLDDLRTFATIDCKAFESKYGSFRGVYFSNRILTNYENVDFSGAMFYRCFPQGLKDALEIEPLTDKENLIWTSETFPTNEQAFFNNGLELRHIKIRNLEFEHYFPNNIDFSFAKFDNVKFRGVNFRECNLHQATFNNCILLGCTFKDCDLSESEFESCRIEIDESELTDFDSFGDGSEFEKCNVSRVGFTNNILDSVEFNLCSFTNSLFESNTFQDVRFDNAHLYEATFKDNRVSQISVDGMLASADLRGLRLYNSVAPSLLKGIYLYGEYNGDTRFPEGTTFKDYPALQYTDEYDDEDEEYDTED